jgi:hypothetical protein
MRFITAPGCAILIAGVYGPLFRVMFQHTVPIPGNHGW